MKRVTFPLSLNDQGPLVGDLHLALRALLDLTAFELPEVTSENVNEVKEKLSEEALEELYGGTTEFLVNQIRKSIGLSDGFVDQQLSRTINSKMWVLKVLDTDSPTRVAIDAKPTIAGRVVFGAFSYFRGTVVLLQMPTGTNDVGIRLGSDSVRQDGSFTIRYEPTSTQSGFLELRFIGSNGTEYGRRSLKDLQSTDYVELPLNADIGVPDNQYATLGGTLEDSQSKALAGYIVSLIHVDLGSINDRVAGRARTSADGGFSIEYRQQIRPPVQGRTTTGLLRIRLQDPYGAPVNEIRIFRLSDDMPRRALTEEEIAGIRPDAGMKLEIVVPVGFPEIDLRNQFQSIRRTIPLLTNGASQAILHKAEKSVRALAARECEVSLEELDDYLLAHRRSEELCPEVRPEAFYALIRKLDLRTPLQIATSSKDSLREAFLAVPPVDSSEARLSVDDLIERVQQRASAAAFGHVVTKDAVDIALRPFFLDNIERGAKIQTLAENSGDLTTIFDISKQSEAKAKRECLVSLRVAAIAESRADLLTALNDYAGSGWRQKILTLDLEQLRTIVQPTSDAEADRRILEEVINLLDRSHPTSAVARVANKVSTENPEAVSNGASLLIRKLVLETDYQIAAGPPEQKHLDAVKANGLQPEIADIASVARLQRLYMISPTIELFGILAAVRKPDGGYFTSANDIASYGREVFLNCFEKSLTPFTAKMLQATHSAAEARADAFARKLISFGQQYNEPAFEALSTKKDIPVQWRKLFGERRHIQCEEWQAIGGPASYLVQILEYLRKRCTRSKDNVTLLDVLAGNKTKSIEGLRPDIAHLPLSPATTNEEVLEIDLNNEILEASILLHEDSELPEQVQYGLDPSAKVSLRVKAYDLLKSKHFPISLPFDRLTSELRHLMKAAEIDIDEYVDLFAEEAFETCHRLNMTIVDHGILTAKTCDASVFGWNSSEQKTSAEFLRELSESPIPRIAQRLDVTISELLSICDTDFIAGTVKATDRDLLRRPPLPVKRFNQIATNAAVTITDEQSQQEQMLFRWLNITPESIRDTIATYANFPSIVKNSLIADPPGQPNLNNVRLRRLDDTPIDEIQLHRLHCFARLARRIGLPIFEVDKLLLAISQNQIGNGQPQTGQQDSLFITTNGLADLAKVLRVSRILKIDPITASAVSGTPHQDFFHYLAQASGPSGTALLGKLNSSETAVLNESEVNTLANFTSLSTEQVFLLQGTKPFSISLLKELYRIQRLSLHLGITPVDCSLLLTGFFDSAYNATPSQTLQFLLWAQSNRNSLQRAASVIRFARRSTNDVPTSRIREQIQRWNRRLAAPAEETGEVGRDSAFSSLFRTSPEIISLLSAHTLSETASDDDVVSFVRSLEISLHLTRVFNLTVDDLRALRRIDVLPLRDVLDSSVFKFVSKILYYVRIQPSRSFEGSTKATGENIEDDLASLCKQAVDFLSGSSSPVDAKINALISGYINNTRFVTRGQSRSGLDETALRTSLEQVLRKRTNALTHEKGTANGFVEINSHSDPLLLVNLLNTYAAAFAALQCTSSPLYALFNDAASDSDLMAIAAGVLGKYTTRDRANFARTVMNDSREKRRTALLSYYKHLIGVSDDVDVFDRLLIDPGSESSLVTTRMSNAIRAVQRFITNVRLGRYADSEKYGPHSCNADQVTPEWDRYLGSLRLTQASLEVLTAPYLFMRPELRDDKTHIFREAESALRKGAATEATAMRVIRSYVDGLAEVNTLQICSTHLSQATPLPDDGADELMPQSTLHIVGRTVGSQISKFFYRQMNLFKNHREWTAWEPVNVQIQAVSVESPQPKRESDSKRPEGVHLAPTVFNGIVYLFWPEFTLKPLGMGKTVPNVNEYGVPSLPPPKYYWQISLCWTTRHESGWTEKTTSRVSFDSPPFEGDSIDPIENLFVDARQENGDLRIFVWPKCVFDFTEAVQSVREFPAQPKAKESNKKQTPKPPQYEPSFPTKFDPIDQTPLSVPSAVAFSPNRMQTLGYGMMKWTHVLTTELQVENLLDRPFVEEMPPAYLEPGGKSLWKIVFENDAENYRCHNADQLTLTFPKSVQTLKGFGKNRFIIVNDNKPSLNPDFFKYFVLDDSIGSFLLQRNEQHLYSQVLTSSLIADFSPKLARMHHRRFLSLSTQRTSVDADRGSRRFELTPDSPPTPLFEFASDSPSGVYAQELFLHLPLLLQRHLSKQGFHEQAVDIGEAVFSPFENQYNGGERGWGFLPFRDSDTDDQDDESLTFDERTLEAWRKNPFQPFRIARLRGDAMRKYAFHEVFAARLAMADNYFRRFTAEFVDKALAQYLILESMLGPQPEISPPPPAPFRSYMQLQPFLDETGNATLDLTSSIPSSSIDNSHAASPGMGAVASLVVSQYFYVPIHPQLLSMWSVVKDRLFKIRNGLTIDGERRRLLPYGVKIDPMSAVRAVASGLPLDEVKLVQNPEPPRLRFAYMLRIIRERIASFARINEKLQQVYERQDAEQLSEMQALHQKTLSEIALQSIEHRIKAAEFELFAAIQQVYGIKVRHRHFYKMLFGKAEDNADPASNDPNLDVPGSGSVSDSSIRDYRLTSLPEGKLSLGRRVVPTVSETVSPFMLAVAPLIFAADAVTDGKVSGFINDTLENVPLYSGSRSATVPKGRVLAEEAEEITTSFEAATLQSLSSDCSREAASVGAIPINNVYATPLGVGVTISPQPIAAIKNATAAGMQSDASMKSFVALMAGKQAQLVMREQEYALQINTLAEECRSQLQRVKAAEEMLDLHKKELDLEKERFNFSNAMISHLKDKFTSKEMYTVMQAELVGFQRSAYDALRTLIGMAWESLKFESLKSDNLPNELPEIQSDTRLRGLVSAESLSFVADSLEFSYLRSRKRKLQYGRSFALSQFDPHALLELRALGTCSFTLPKSIFDILDSGAMKERRIVDVSLALPAVTSRFGSVNAGLEYLGDPEGRWPEGRRIVTTTGIGDSGRFDSVDSSELYRVFEGLPCDDSTWRIELPSDPRTFAYSTISDAILTLSIESVHGESPSAQQLAPLNDWPRKDDLSNVSGQGAKLKGIWLSYSVRENNPLVWQRLRTGEETLVSVVPDISWLPMVFEKGSFGTPYVYRVCCVKERERTFLREMDKVGDQSSSQESIFEATGSITLYFKGDVIKGSIDVVLLLHVSFQ